MMATRQAMPDASALADDGAAHAEQVVARSGTSFYWSMRLLPPDQRAAMFAVYAFCREIDDIADGDDPMAQKLAALGEWRAEIDRVFASSGNGGAPRSPTGRSLVAPVKRFALARADFIALIDGMEMDATGPIVAPDWATLRLYCARVAGAVGLLSVKIYGLPDAEGKALADALGEAVQLTNILRDIDEDAGLGRLYLPAELLRRHGVPASPAGAIGHPALGAAAAEVGVAARARFADAGRILAVVDRRRARPARVIFAVYSRLLERLLAVGFAPPRHRVSLGKLEKLWLALRYGVL
jgi:phytoene synthase